MVEIQDDNAGRFCYIKQVDNGFMLQTEDNILVVEEKESDTDSDHQELVSMKSLLGNVKELFGVHNSEKKKENIIIKIEKNKL